MESRWVRAGMVSVLLTGCFAAPPQQGTDDTTGGSTSTAEVTGTSAASGSAESSEDVTTTGAAESSSSTGSVGSSSSGPEPETSTGPSPACPDGEVQVGALCFVPLVVDGIGTHAEPPAPTPLGDDPCLPAMCPDGLALGGGFLLDGAVVHASHRDENVETWQVCGAPDPDATPNLWQSYARCVSGQGDVLVNTETFALDGDEGPTCYEAECPPGTTLVGGGGRWGPSFGLQGSEPSADGSQWEVCGSGTGELAMVEVDAHCAVLPAGVQTEVFQEVEPVAVGQSGCAQASCAPGLPLAGGVSAGISMTVLGSYPEGERWTACGHVEGNFNVQVRSRVLCLQN